MNHELKFKIIRKLRRYLDKLAGNAFSYTSFSLEAEDMILRVLLKGKQTGFYIDVGAHHPRRFSNTCFFYRNGWKGINIDPLPGSMQLFKQQRPRDINLEIGISAARSSLIYYSFEDPAYNGFNPEIGEARIKDGIRFKEKLEIETYPLAEILGEHIPKGQEIDFLTLDVEGLELEVLDSNDWNRFVPKFIVCEILACSLKEAIDHPISKYLEQHGYELVSKGYHSFFYQHKASGSRSDG